MDIDFRAVLEEDFPFLYRLHRLAMQEHVQDTWGEWDEDWQVSHFRQQFHPSHLQMIQYQGQDVGVLYIQERAEEIFIANLEILPEFQRRGIGTAVLQEMIQVARRQGKLVALQVLKVNRHARSLYQRLGFGVTGENDSHYIMAFENPNGF